MCDSGCVSVVPRVVAWGGREGGGGEIVSCLYSDKHTTSILNPLTCCLSALLIDGDHVGEYYTNREQVNKITRHTLHTKPVLMREQRAGKRVCPSYVLYPV